MMTCRELTEHLLEFVTGELTTELRVQFEEHLCACPQCEVYVQTYRLTIHLSRRLPCSGMLPDHLRRRCEEMLRREGKCEGGPG